MLAGVTHREDTSFGWKSLTPATVYYSIAGSDQVSSTWGVLVSWVNRSLSTRSWTWLPAPLAAPRMWTNRCMHDAVCPLHAGQIERAGDAAKSGEFLGQFSWAGVTHRERNCFIIRLVLVVFLWLWTNIENCNTNISNCKDNVYILRGKMLRY